MLVLRTITVVPTLLLLQCLSLDLAREALKNIMRSGLGRTDRFAILRFSALARLPY